MGKFGKLGGAVVILAIAATVASVGVVAWPATGGGGVVVDDVTPAPLTGAPLGSRTPAPGGPTRDPVEHRVVVLTGRSVAADNGTVLGEAQWTWYRAEDRQHESRHRTHHGADLRVPLGDLTGTILIRVDAPGRVPQRCRITVDGATDVAIGTLALRRGIYLRGTLRDTAGDPVADARLRFARRGAPHRSGPALELAPPEVRTAFDGSFELPWDMAPGPYQLHLYAAPKLVSSPVLHLAADAGETVLDLVCAASNPADEIHGIVVGLDGEVLSGVKVELQRYRRLMDRSRRDGTFAFYRPEGMARGDKVRVTVSNTSGGAQHEPVTTTWGTDDLTLILQPGRRILVKVTAAGEPVADFAVRAYPMVGPRNSEAAAVRVETRAAEDGTAWVDDLRSGSHLVVVHPRGEYEGQLLSSLPIPFDVPARGDGELRVELPNASPLEVRVTRSDGKPFVGSSVELLVLRGLTKLGPRTSITDLPDFFEPSATRGECAIRVARSNTDEGGAARLSWYPSGTALTVRVLGRHPEWQRDGFVFERQGQVLRIVLSEGASLHGELTPVGHLRWLHGITTAEHERMAFLGSQVGPAAAAKFWRQRASGLVLVDVTKPAAPLSRLPRHPNRRFLIDANGGFDITGIPAGTWQVYLERRNARGLFEELGRSLGKLVLTDGTRRHRDFDLSNLVEPSVVTGDVRWNGESLAGASVRITWRQRSGVVSTAATTRTNSAGSFRFEGLAGRTYRLEVRLAKFPIPLGGEFELRPGGHHSEAFDLKTVAVRLKLEGDVMPRVVELRDPTGFQFRRRPNADGEVFLPNLPVGSYRLVGSDGPELVVRKAPAEQVFTRKL